MTEVATLTRYRKMRIAWTNAAAVAAVLLCVLWVVSLWIAQGLLYTHGTTRIALWVSSGYAGLNWMTLPASTLMADEPGFTWNTSDPLPEHRQTTWVWSSLGLSTSAPVWNCEIVLLVLAVLPWLSYRFSLRTLLIAMTLVALVLGFAVWAAG